VASDAQYDLAYTEALRALDQQDRVRESYQSRAGTIVAASTIATGFFAPIAWPNRHGNQHTAAVVAVAAFALTVAAVLIAIRPRKGWGFATDPAKIIADYIEHPTEPLTLPQTKRDLALHYGEAYTENNRRLVCIYFWVSVAGFLLFAEMLAWIASLTL
jgi:hypothetical protein